MDLTPFRLVVPEYDNGKCIVVGRNGLELLDAETMYSTRFDFDGLSYVQDGDVSAKGDVAIITRDVWPDSFSTRYDHALYDFRTRAPQLRFATFVVNADNIGVSNIPESGPETGKIRFLGADSPRVAALVDDGTVHVYDLRQTARGALQIIRVRGPVEPARWENGLPIPASARHAEKVTVLASMPGSDIFCTGSTQDGLRIWDVDSKQNIQHLSQCDGEFEPSVVRGSTGFKPSFYAYEIDDMIGSSGKMCEFVLDDNRPVASFDAPEVMRRELCSAIVGNTFDALVCGGLTGQFMAWVVK